MELSVQALTQEIKTLLSVQQVKEFIKYYQSLVETDDRNKIVVLAYVLNSLVDKPEVRAALSDLTVTTPCSKKVKLHV